MSAPLDLRPLWHYVERQFRIGPHTLHGPAHLRRVERNGLTLAEHRGADVRVVRLFAVLHDACRVDEGSDIGHGTPTASTCRVSALGPCRST